MCIQKQFGEFFVNILPVPLSYLCWAVKISWKNRYVVFYNNNKLNKNIKKGSKIVYYIQSQSFIFGSSNNI